MPSVNNTPAQQAPVTHNALAEYIEANTFRRMLSGDKIIDTRPYVGIIHKPKKAPLIGLRFNGYGMLGKWGEPSAPEIENSGYLPVTHFEAGSELPIYGKDWQAILSALPPGTTVFVDEWKDSKQDVASVTFLKRPDGSWNKSGADKTN